MAPRARCAIDGTSLALKAVGTGADCSLAIDAAVDAGTVAKHLGVGAARADRPGGGVVAAAAAVPADAPGALAGVAGLINPVGAGKRGAALPAVVTRGIGDQAGAAAVVLAPVEKQKLAAIALRAVLAKLVGAELAILAGCGPHVVGGALAAVGEVLALDPAGGARECLHAAALEIANAERGRAGWARLNAGGVEQVPAVATDPAGVALGVTVAVVAVVVEALAVRAGLRP